MNTKQKNIHCEYSQAALHWLEGILKERYGYDFRLKQKADNLILSLNSSNGSICFDNLQSIFHESKSNFPCHQWQASIEGYQGPIEDLLFAPSEDRLSSPLIELEGKNAKIHYDILGLTYWMLTRLEELGRIDLDEHQRFPALSSHAYKNNYLERPVVDEWLNILGQVINRVWPHLVTKKHKFTINVSHDVDKPSLYGFKSWPTITRMMAGSILKRRDINAFFAAPYVKLTSQTQLKAMDTYNTFDWLMDISEKNNLKSAFYFICGRTDVDRDADYEPEHKIIRNLMRRINQRGHEIGLHPSYNTFQKPELIKQESERLKRICRDENIDQLGWGGRMHYLRWEQPVTMQAWDDAGMTYDSTLGYADRPGFRCGTCFEYPAFNAIAQQELRLRIRPLVVMECSVFDSAYLGLGITEAAENKIVLLKETCKKVGGSFNILWHNSYFMASGCKSMYERCLKA